METQAGPPENWRWVLVEFASQAVGYKPGEASGRVGPALTRAVTFVDVLTLAASGAGSGLGAHDDMSVGLELRFGTEALLSLRMNDSEVTSARTIAGVTVGDDVRVVAIDSHSSGGAQANKIGERPSDSVARIGAKAAWCRTEGETDLAFLDSGICAHPDLTDVQSITVMPDGDPEDHLNHGTLCAGVLAARRNDRGLIGVAPRARLLSIKVMDRAGLGWGGWLASGALWCLGRRVAVASMSVGLKDPPPVLERLFAAVGQDVVLVAAAGNRTALGHAVMAPARYPSVIAVSAVDEQNGLSDLSCYGPEVDLAAPGTGVETTAVDGYVTSEGTSLACPHVAGVAALVSSLPQFQGAASVRARLLQTARDLGNPDFYGAGMVDADRATAP